MTNRGTIGYVEEVRRIAGELHVEWRINDLSTRNEEQFDYYESRRFSFCDGCWYFEVCPNRKTSGQVSLRLIRNDSGTDKAVNVVLGTRAWFGYNEYKREERIFRSGDSLTCKKICPASVKELIIVCKMKTPGTATDIYTQTEDEMKEARVPIDGKLFAEKQDICTQTEEEFKEARVPIDGKLFSEKQDIYTQTDDEVKEARVPIDGKLSSEKEGNGESSRKRKFLESGEASVFRRKMQAAEKAMEDFGKMLASGENSDVIVRVKESEFKAHRAILSARSPVLSAMFQHERTSDKIIIDDWEPEVFKEYLQYLYTGSVQSLTEQNVFGLYSVADKSQTVDLKEQCLEHIRNALSVQTFCNVVQLALTHGESGLLDKAVAFATENIRSIICTVEWLNFIREYPAEANEVLIKSLGPQV